MSLQVSKRKEIAIKIEQLEESLGRANADQTKPFMAEIEALKKTYNELPLDQVDAGTIFLKKQVIYIGNRYSLKPIDGKLRLYDDEHVISSNIEFDGEGTPIRATRSTQSSDYPYGAEFVYNFKIDQPEPQKPKREPTKVKLHEHWYCPHCRQENDIDRDTCFWCRAKKD